MKRAIMKYFWGISDDNVQSSQKESIARGSDVPLSTSSKRKVTLSQRGGKLERRHILFDGSSDSPAVSRSSDISSVLHFDPARHFPYELYTPLDMTEDCSESLCNRITRLQVFDDISQPDRKIRHPSELPPDRGKHLFTQFIIIRVFRRACVKQDWELFNSMYSDLLLVKKRSINLLHEEMQYIIHHFVKENIEQNAKKVYFGFCLKRKQTVLVVIIDNVFFDLRNATTSFMGLPILYKQWLEITEESVNTRKYEANEDSLGFKEDDHAKIHDCLKQKSAILMQSHSNIEIICASPYRSIDSGRIIHKENCILIYCTMKNVVPLGEMCFEETLADFKIDVREGFFLSIPKNR